MPSDWYFRNGHTLGSLQHAPHWTHRPLRFFAAGRNEVSVLLNFADQVFCRSTTISDDSTRYQVRWATPVLVLVSGHRCARSFGSMSRRSEKCLMGCIVPTPNGVRFRRICADSFFEKRENRKRFLLYVSVALTTIARSKNT